MKQNSMFLRSFIFVGNIVLVVTIITTTNIIPNHKKAIVKTKPLYSSLENRLIDRGLEKEFAEKIVKKIKISEYAVYMLAKELNTSKEKIYDKVLNKALRREDVDLTHKSTLIALAQSLNGGYINDNLINKIHNLQNEANKQPYFFHSL